MIFSRYPGRYPLFFQASPGRWRVTFEMTFVTLMAVLAGQTFHLPLVDIYPMVILILWKDNRVLNIILGCMLFGLIGCIIMPIAFCGVWIDADNSSLKFLIDIFFAFLFFFLTIGSKLGTLLGPICGMSTAYGLLELSRVPSGEAITEGLLYLLLSIAISCGGMILGGLILSPSPQRVLCTDIAWRLRVSADLLEGRSKEEGSWQESEKLLHGGAIPLLTNVKLASLEKLWEPLILNRLRQASLHVFSCLALSRMAILEIGWGGIGQNQAARKLSKIMREMAEVFERGDIAVAPRLNLEEDFNERHPILIEISQQLEDFSEVSKVSFPQAPKTGFIFPGAFQSAENFRFATKGALVVGICICLYLALDWSGIHTCVITCFLVGLPTVGEMVTKQVARISGAMVGAVLTMLGMIFILPSFNNIVQLLLFLGVGFGAAAWLKSGPEKFSYAGFQVAVVIALSLLGKNYLDLDLTTPRDRIIGIFIGLVLTYVVFTRLWPTSSATRLPPLFQKCFSALERQYATKERVMRLFWGSAAQGALSEAKSFLAAARTEAPPVRLSESRLKAIEKAIKASEQLMQILLLPPTAERTESAKSEKDALKRLLRQAALLDIPGHTPSTKEFSKNPAPT